MTTYKILGKDIERYRIDLLKACQDLHMYCTGAMESDGIFPHLYYLFIKARLNDWQPSPKPGYFFSKEPDANFFDGYEGFDDIVKMLCKEAIRNYQDSFERISEETAQNWVDKDPSIWEWVLK